MPIKEKKSFKNSKWRVVLKKFFQAQFFQILKQITPKNFLKN